MKTHLIDSQRPFHQLVSFLLPWCLLFSVQVLAEINTEPQQLIVHTHSASDISLSWQAPLDASNVIGYRIFRNSNEVATTTSTSFVDNNLSVNTQYSYYVTAFDNSGTNSGPSNTDSTKTLLTADNDGLRNGAGFRPTGIRLRDICPENFRRNTRLSDIPTEDLDSCLNRAIEHYDLENGLEDIRAFTARLRQQENPMLINLGKRLFHSTSLSQNNDTACSSCHHPALSCGSDNLSLPIGVNANNPNLLGLGRSDGNFVPLVGRSAPHICNSALWIKSMFWDQRISLQEANRNSAVGVVSTADVRTP